MVAIRGGGAGRAYVVNPVVTRIGCIADGFIIAGLLAVRWFVLSFAVRAPTD